MVGTVIYDTNVSRASEIADMLMSSTGISHRVFSRDNASREVLLDACSIAVSWNLRYDLLEELIECCEGSRILFFNDKDLIDIDENRKLESLRTRAVNDENYDLSKGINELMIFSDVLRRRTMLTGYPSKLQLETTNRCNAKCIMCSHAYETEQGIDILDTNVLEHIQGVLPFVRTMILHGNGEPFLKNNIVEYLNRLRRYGIKFVTNTNLSVLTDEIIELMRTGFEEVNISCDGHTKELYESIRVGLDFDHFCRNIRLLRERCPELTLKMAVVVMKQNMPFLSNIVDFAADLDFDEIDLNQLCVDEKNGNLDCAPYLYRQEYKKSLEKAEETALKRNITIRMPHFSEVESSKATDKEPSVKGICDWIIASPYINLTGEVGICCMNQNYNMGNLQDTSFEDIWNGKKYQDFRRVFYCGMVPDVCRGCDFLIQKRLSFVDYKANIKDMLDKRVRR